MGPALAWSWLERAPTPSPWPGWRLHPSDPRVGVGVGGKMDGLEG